MALPLDQYSLNISIYLISIMLAIGGISLGIGYAMNEKRIKEFGRKELFESVINGAIVGGIFLLFTANGPVTTLINQMTLSNGTTLNCYAFISNNTAICLAYDYLASPTPYTFMGMEHQSVLSLTTSAMTGLFALNGVLGLIAGLKINLAIATFSFSYVFAPVISELQYIMKLLGAVAISAVVQASILEFAAVITLSVLLPSGIVLRTFYPTRKVGGFLMAASIGLYVVLPLSYVFNATIANAYSSSLNPINISQISITASDLKNSVFQQSVYQQTNSTLNSSDTGGILGSISSGVAYLTNALSGFINGILRSVAYLIVYSFVLPIFSLIITGISIREISGLLGSEAFFGKFNIL